MIIFRLEIVIVSLILPTTQNAGTRQNRLIEAALTSTHNSRPRADKKNNVHVYSWRYQFCNIKVGFDGLFTAPVNMMKAHVYFIT